MATSTLLTHSPPPFSLPHRRRPPSFSVHLLSPPPFRRSLLCPLPRTLSLLTHSVEHLPRTSASASASASASDPASTTSSSLRITPLRICFWALVASLSLVAIRALLAVLFHPLLGAYVAIACVHWPAVCALLATVVSLFSLLLPSRPLPLQLLLLSTSLMWLTLVPTALRNGFLEGWPVAFFFVYHYFFFFESTIRRRLYGDLLPRPHDPRWDIAHRPSLRVLFALALLAVHWLAALEGPELHLTRGWLEWLLYIPLWLLILAAFQLRYHSVDYLAKYSEKVAEPTVVVQFGPYRILRHPIYASAILLFATFCIAMRAPRSMVLMVLLCLAYYGKKAAMEEEVLREVFGEKYDEYARRVPYRLIPFLY